MQMANIGQAKKLPLIINVFLLSVDLDKSIYYFVVAANEKYIFFIIFSPQE